MELFDHSTSSHAIYDLKKSFKNQLDALRKLRDLQVERRALKNTDVEIVLGQFDKYLKNNLKTEKHSVSRALRKIRLKKLEHLFLKIKNEIKLISHSDQGNQIIRKLAQIANHEFKTLDSYANRVAPNEPKTFHKTRIQFKKFRYSYEFIQPSIPIPKKSKIKMNKFQTLLGEIQDSVVITKSIVYFLNNKKNYPTHKNELKNFFILENVKMKNKMKQFQMAKKDLLSALQPHL